MKLFDAGKGSNIGRGLFVVLSYVTGIFNKMIIAGSRRSWRGGMIAETGVPVSFAVWLAAFVPMILVTVVAAWWFTLKAFPPEASSLVDRSEEVKAHFRKTEPWSPLSIKSAVLCGLALLLWLTDALHGISPAIVAFAVGLFALMPVHRCARREGFPQASICCRSSLRPPRSAWARCWMPPARWRIVTDTFIGGLEPWLADRALAVTVLYWGGFFYPLHHRERALDARDVDADPDGILAGEWTRSAVRRLVVVVLHRRETFRLSVGRAGAGAMPTAISVTPT
jgi:hypothetical protein